jgi:hypothetical protein
MNNVEGAGVPIADLLKERQFYRKQCPKAEKFRYGLGMFQYMKTIILTSPNWSL